MSSNPNIVFPDTGDWDRDPFAFKIDSQFGSYREAAIKSSQVFHHFGDDTSSKIVEKVANNIDSPSDLGFFDLKGSSISPWYFALGKMRDTTLGGNDVVNPLPQYCRYDDIVPPFNSNFSSGCTGEGRVYSKVFDDNQRVLYLSFGIPVFNALMAFYSQAADETTANLNDRGFLFNTSKQLTSIFLTPASLVVKLPVLPFVWLERIAMFDGAPINKYYDFQSQMPMYYRYVNTILIALAVNMNLIKSLPAEGKGYGSGTDSGSSGTKGSDTPSTNNTGDGSSNNGTTTTPKGQASVNGFTSDTNWSGTKQQNMGYSGDSGKAAWPDYLIKYQLDVGQILHKRQKFIYGSKIRNQDISTDSLLASKGGYGKSILSAAQSVGQSLSGELIDMLNPSSKSNNAQGVEDAYGFVDKAAQSAKTNVGNLLRGVTAAPTDPKNPTSDEKKAYAAGSEATVGNSTNSIFDKSSQSLPRFLKQLFDGFKAGAQPALYLPLYYVGFRVERGIDTSEQLSNSVGKSSVQQQLNQKFDQGREMLFSLARGHLGNASGLVGAVVDSGADVLSGVVSGVSNSLGLGGLAALATGSGLIDIPMEWKDSEFRKDYTFSMKFKAPTGNRVSIFQSVMFPLAFLMAGSFPRAQGMASYGSPFLCKAFCKGMLSVPLGMITSLSISRGGDVNGWSIDNLPTEVTVHFTIQDLTPIMYMAMGSGGNGLISGVATDLERALIGTVDCFTEYMATLGGLGIDDRFGMAGLQRRFKEFENTLVSSRYSRFDFGMQLGQNMPVRALSFLVNKAGQIAHGDWSYDAFGGPNTSY